MSTALFPLEVVTELGWAAIPMTVLVCAALFSIGEVGRVLEDRRRCSPR